MKRLFLFLAPALLLLFALPMLARAHSQDSNHAGLVVRFGDGRVATACVAFSEPSISGLQLLERSGIPILVQGGGIGAAVCKIDDEGCDYPTEDCFCKRDGQRSIYWAYSRLRGDAWAYSPLGASGTKVQPGDVDGWAWGSGDTQSGAQPPVLTFEQLCALAQAPTTPRAPTRVPATLVPTRLPAIATIAPTVVPTDDATAIVAVATAATDIPTSAPVATDIPTSAPVATTVPAAEPTHIQPAIAPTTIAAAPAAGETSLPWNYIAFGAIAIALIVCIVIALQR